MSFQEITSQSPFEDNLVTKEPNLPQTYTFFFEINKNNYKNICIPLPFIKSFQGYKLDSLWDNNKLCYTCNRNEDNFNYPITNNKQTLAFANEGGIPIPPNTFIILDEMKGFDTISFQCASSTNINGCLSYSNSNICIGDQDIEMEITQTPSTPDDSKKDNFENTIITNKNQITSSLSCSGKSCLSFFPPESVSLIKTDNNEKIKLKIMENLQPCSGSSFNLSEGFPACSDNNGNPVALCVSGNPTFHYMVYIPNSYRNSPTFDSNSIYQIPKIFKSGFYNHGNFLATLSLLQSSIQKGNNLPEGTFAIYEVSYNLTVDTSIQFQIMDFLSLQNQLSGTFTNWFKKTKIYNSSLENMKKLIQNFCNSSPETALCIEKMKLPNLENQIENFEFPKESNNRTNYIIFIVSILLIILLYFRKLY